MTEDKKVIVTQETNTSRDAVNGSVNETKKYEATGVEEVDSEHQVEYHVDTETGEKYRVYASLQQYEAARELDVELYVDKDLLDFFQHDIAVVVDLKNIFM